MGAWGYGVFENDDAADWLADFVNHPNKLLMCIMNNNLYYYA